MFEGTTCMNAVSIDVQGGRARLMATSADMPLRERVASEDITLERCNVVGELVEPLPRLLKGFDVFLA
jgi:hypothetical protein